MIADEGHQSDIFHQASDISTRIQKFSEPIFAGVKKWSDNELTFLVPVLDVVALYPTFKS